MEMEGEEVNGKVVMMGRAEIDTRRPFKSVKEAVLSFGERVLVKEIYGVKLKEMQPAASIGGGGFHHKTRIGALTTELEEARESLKTTREEIAKMSHTTRTLKEELEETKKELKQMKAKEYYNLKLQAVDDDDNDNDTEIDDLKFIEKGSPKEEEECDEKKRYVTFASPPQVIVGKEEMTKKKTLMMRPLIGWLFSVKRSGGQGVMNSPKRK